MRLVLVALAVMTLANPASAQRIGEVEASPTLRGAVQPEAPPTFFTPEPIMLAAPQSPVIDTPRCRMACAKDYYFCLAQDDATECGPGWRECVLTCGISATPAAPGV